MVVKNSDFEDGTKLRVEKETFVALPFKNVSYCGKEGRFYKVERFKNLGVGRFQSVQRLVFHCKDILFSVQ